MLTQRATCWVIPFPIHPYALLSHRKGSVIVGFTLLLESSFFGMGAWEDVLAEQAFSIDGYQVDLSSVTLSGTYLFFFFFGLFPISGRRIEVSFHVSPSRVLLLSLRIASLHLMFGLPFSRRPLTYTFKLLLLPLSFSPNVPTVSFSLP